jgi:hypothetical protein
MNTEEDVKALDQRLLHLELVVARLSEQVKRLVEDVIALRAGRSVQDTFEQRAAKDRPS